MRTRTVTWSAFLLAYLSTVTGEFTHGKNYHLINAGNNLCLSSNPNHFRSEVGVFLGQVTLEECDLDNGKQKWGVILWAKENGKKQYWFYSLENGLNELTSLLTEDGVYPVNNLMEVTQVVVNNGKSRDERFVLKSVEFNQCVASQGKNNPITYEYCDVKRRDQQWKTKLSNDEPVTQSITGRSLTKMTVDLFKYAINFYSKPSTR